MNIINIIITKIKNSSFTTNNKFNKNIFYIYNPNKSILIYIILINHKNIHLSNPFFLAQSVTLTHALNLGLPFSIKSKALENS